MSNPTVSFMSTPRGSNVFKDMFDEEQSKMLAERMMAPMPMIVVKGPKEASRHWDWKVSDGLDIVVPTVKTFIEPHVLKPGEIVFDEAADINWSKIDLKGKDLKYDLWKKMWEGSFSTAEEVPLEPLTIDSMTEAMEKLDMPRKIPKKRKVRGDTRRAKYSARQFGNILLSMTKDIINNTTLNDALGVDGITESVHELIKPLFEEFFLVHGNKWQITGPMRLSAQSVETGKWKSVSALGGEILHYQDMEIGTRDGVCILWETGNIVGMNEEMIINTTIKGFGSKIVSAELKGNPANRQTLVDLLLNHAGTEDIVDAAAAAKLKIETAAQEKRLKDIKRKAKAYGEGFGSWA